MLCINLHDVGKVGLGRILTPKGCRDNIDIVVSLWFTHMSLIPDPSSVFGLLYMYIVAQATCVEETPDSRIYIIWPGDGLLLHLLRLII